NKRLVTLIYLKVRSVIEKPNFEDIINYLEKLIFSTRYPNSDNYILYYNFLLDNMQITTIDNRTIINNYTTINSRYNNINDAYYNILYNLIDEIIFLIKNRIKSYENKENKEFDNLFNVWFKNN